MSKVSSKDLVVLVADNDIRAVMKELVGERFLDMGIRRVNFDILPENPRDHGCRKDAHNTLREHCGNYKHALVVFDQKGSDEKDRSKIEQFVERKLAPNGWPGDRAAVIVIEPELEAWAWCSSNNLQFVQQILGVRPRAAFTNLVKAAKNDPKEAFKRACKQARKRKSPERYRELAKRLPMQNCQDPAFQKLMTTLQRWFP